MKNRNKKLIINADDFGYTLGVTQGIIEAHNEGVVTSTTALTVSKHFLKAMELARLTAPTLAIGVHLTLTLNGGSPILSKDRVPSLVDENGNFWSQRIFHKKVRLNEVYEEWDAQIIEFLRSGRRPDHIDSHHNVHGRNEDLLNIALDLARKYKLPLRNASRCPETENMINLYKDVRTPDKMIAKFYGENATFEQLEEILSEITTSDKEVFEMNCHPAFVDPALEDMSSYCMNRLNELRILTLEKTKEAVKEKGVLLANYEILR